MTLLNRYDLLKVEENLLYTKLLVKLPPPHKSEKKKSWLDIAGSSFKNTIDGTFRNVAGVVANKVCIYSFWAHQNSTVEDDFSYLFQITIKHILYISSS